MREKQTEKNDALGSNENEINVKLDKEKLNEVKENYNDTVKKESRGRKKKADIEAEQKLEEQKNSFADVSTFSFSVGFSMLIERISPDKPLTEKETENLDKSFRQVAYKYAEILQRFGAEANLALALIFIVIARSREINELFRRKNKNNIWKDGDGKNGADKISNKPNKSETISNN